MVPLPTAWRWPLAAAFFGVSTALAQTSVNWQAGNSTWFTNSNWSSGFFPTNSFRAVINTANTVTASGSTGVNVAALDITASGAQLIFDYSSNGPGLSLGTASSTWANGTSIEFRTSSGIGGNGSANTSLSIAAGSQVLFNTNIGTRYIQSLALANAGTITATTGTLSFYNGTVNNTGLIHANGAAIEFTGLSSFSNTGTIRATGSSGKLMFNSGTYTTASLGTVDLVSGARATIGGTITNTSATLNAPTGGTYELLGGTITNGTIASGALTFTSSGGYLNGAALTGNLALPNGTYVYLKSSGASNASFTGTNLTLGNNAAIYWQQIDNLVGKAITFGSNAQIQVIGVNNTLTLGSGTTVTGDIDIHTDGNNGTAITNAGTITHNTGSGTLYGRTVNNSGTITASSGTSFFLGSTSTTYLTNNSGTITADGSGTQFYLDGTVANTGTVIAQNGAELYYRGTNTSANLGTVQIGSGSHAYLNGTITNTSSTLAAPSSGVFELYGGTVTGGTIGAGALTFTSSGGYLDQTTYTGNLTLPSNTGVRLTNGTTFSGSNLTLNSNTWLYWQQNGTLSNKTISIGSSSYIWVPNVNTLTLDAATTVTGDVDIYGSSSSGTTITNAGTITHNSGFGNMYAASFTNSGSITVNNAATFDLGTTSTGYNTFNTGNVTVSGANSVLHVDGNVQNSGTLSALTGGAMYLRGTNYNGNLGSIVLDSSSHVYLAGTLENGASTLTAPTGGKFEFYGGTINGGTIAANALTFTNNGGYLNGVSYTGDINLANSAYVRFLGGTGFTGSNFTFGSNASLYWNQAGALTGKALTFGSGAYLYVYGVNNTLTLASGSTATGEISIYTDGSNGTAVTNAGTITHTSGTGQLYGRAFTNSGSITASAGSLAIGSTSSGYDSSNTGSITSTGSGTIVYLDGNVVNTGTLAAQSSGQLRFRGTNVTGNLGTVQLSTGGHAYLNGTLDNTSATLMAPTGGSYELLGGTIVGGNIANNALTLTSSGGNIDGATLLGDYGSPAGTGVVVKNGATFTGANALLGNSSWLYWQQVGTLTGKALAFGTNAYVYINGLNNTLTLGTGTTATGQVQIYSDGSIGTALTNQGTITHNVNATGYLYARNFTNSGSITATAGSLNIGNTSSSYLTNNSGTITADGSGATVYLNGAVANTGTLVAQNGGQLRFYGTNTTGNLGIVQIGTGSHGYIVGDLDNTSATLNAPSSGVYELLGGTILNGTIASGALTFTSSGGYLDGATVTGNFTLPSNTGVRLQNGATFSGAAANIGQNSYVYWQQIGTLVGKALNFADGAYIYITGVNRSLTLDSASSATGTLTIQSDGSSGTTFVNEGSLTHTAGNGQLYARSFTNSGLITTTNGTLTIGVNSPSYATTNASTGIIKADGVAAIVHLNGGVVNQGSLIAQNSGKLWFEGSTNTANLGSVTINSGGHAYLNGSLNNASATLTAPTGGSYELYGGTITGGTVAANALTFTNGSGTLNGVTLLGNVSLPDSSYAYFTNGTTLATLNAALGFGNNAGLYWQQSGTLNGNALTFGSNAYFYLSNVNSGVTLNASTTATGNVNIYSDGSAGTYLTNNGAITHTGGNGNLYALTFTNNGSITATGGTLFLGTTSTGAVIANNTGATLRLNGGNMSLQTPASLPLLNHGVIDLQSGTFFTNNHLTNASGGLIRGAGIINGGLTVTGGTLEPGNSGIGNLRFAFGTLMIAGASSLTIDIDGSLSDALIFQSPGSAVALGTGLLTLNLNLLSAPTPNTTYNIITFSSGVQPITGTFANLSTSGSLITANFAGNPYTFSINYQTNLVSLNYSPILVPEPSEYALMALGLAVVGYAVRRRRR